MRAVNHVDGRRQLLPRDYLADPHRFGVDPAARRVVPPSGDEVSGRIAWLQHRLACRWHQVDQRPSAAAIAQRYGLSKQVMSRSLRGERWMGETVVCALLDELTRPGSPPDRPA